MFKFKGYFERIDLPKEAFTKALNEALSTQVRQAAREYLRAAILKVPVYTGTAKGSLQPLGRYLGVAVPVRPEKTYKGMGPEVGARQQDFKFTEGEGGSFLFKLKIEVAHFLINDFYPKGGTDVVSESGNLRNPIPWGATEAGRAAFKAYLRENLEKRIPKIKKFVSRTRLELG